MAQTPITSKLVTFEEFVEWYPHNGVRYELHKGVVVEISQPVGGHENIVGFLVVQISFQLMQMELPYRIPKTALVKTSESTYSPDILLLNHDNLISESSWQKYSTVTNAESVPLVIEVVSTNWRDDYYNKFGDYEKMGISEYWIVDYAGLGGRDFIGNPKQPAIFVCELVDGEYVKTLFRGNNLIISPTFPNLNLTAQQIFASAL